MDGWAREESGREGDLAPRGRRSGEDHLPTLHPLSVLLHGEAGCPSRTGACPGCAPAEPMAAALSVWPPPFPLSGNKERRSQRETLPDTGTAASLCLHSKGEAALGLGVTCPQGQRRGQSGVWDAGPALDSNSALESSLRGTGLPRFDPRGAAEGLTEQAGRSHSPNSSWYTASAP